MNQLLYGFATDITCGSNIVCYLESCAIPTTSGSSPHVLRPTPPTYMCFWWSRRESNSHIRRYQILNLARLPSSATRPIFLELGTGFELFTSIPLPCYNVSMNNIIDISEFSARSFLRVLSQLRSRDIVTTDCFWCGVHFERKVHVLRRTLKRGGQVFCSRNCASQWRAAQARELPNEKCACCSKSLYVSPQRRQRSKSGLFFCDAVCRSSAQCLDSGVPRFRPTVYDTEGTEYRRIALRTYPHICDRCGWDEFPKLLVVHHRNGDDRDHRVENLKILCRNCHRLIHWVWNGTLEQVEGIEPPT